MALFTRDRGKKRIAERRGNSRKDRCGLAESIHPHVPLPRHRRHYLSTIATETAFRWSSVRLPTPPTHLRAANVRALAGVVLLIQHNHALHPFYTTPTLLSFHREREHAGAAVCTTLTTSLTSTSTIMKFYPAAICTRNSGNRSNPMLEGGRLRNTTTSCNIRSFARIAATLRVIVGAVFPFYFGGFAGFVDR